MKCLAELCRALARIFESHYPKWAIIKHVVSYFARKTAIYSDNDYKHVLPFFKFKNRLYPLPFAIK